jgi:hypothetical protein
LGLTTSAASQLVEAFLPVENPIKTLNNLCSYPRKSALICG